MNHYGDIRRIHYGVHAGVSRLSLDPTKCVFRVTSGALLGHIVSKEGIEVDLDKAKAILEAPPPTNAKALSRFLGHIR